MLRRYWHHLIVLLAYLALALLLTFPLVREFGHAIPGDGFDGWQNVWNIWWVKQALLVEGANPYFTRLVDYPAGVYLYFHTLNIFNGLTFLPITLNGGNLVAYNIAVVFSFVIGGYGAYLLALRVLGCPDPEHSAHLTLARLAAFVGGFVFAFSPYHMAHLLGHLQLISLEWLPFVALAAISLLSRAGDRYFSNAKTQRRKGAKVFFFASLRLCARKTMLVALFLVLVALCDWYYAFYMVLFSGLLWLWMLAHRGSTSASLREWQIRTLSLLGAGAMFLLIMSPVWLPMVRETLTGDYMVPPADSVLELSADLTAFFTPSTLHPWWGEWAAGWASRFTATTSEQTVFAGYSVLALALIGLLTQRRKAAFWGLAALVFGGLALGPVLHIGGQTRFAGEVPVLSGGIGPIPMPYALLSRIVPLLKISRSVSRFDVVVTLCLGVLAAIGLAWLLSRIRAVPLAKTGDYRRHPFAAGLVGVAALCLVGLEYLAAPYPVSFPETRPFHQELAREPDGFAVMDIPMDWDRPANLLYQTVHRKPLVSGYTSRTNPLSPAWRTPVLQTFRYLGPDINSGDPQALAATVLTDLNVRYVIVHKNDLPPGAYRQQTLALAQELFGKWPVPVDDDWLKVFRVPDEPDKRLPYLVLGEGWGERQWDGQRPARAITASQATVLARLPTSQTIYLEIEAFSADPSAMLLVQTGDQPAQSWPVGARPTVIRTPAWPLPPGETLIQLRPDPPSASVVATRISLVPVP